METLFQMILPAAVLPFILSAVVWILSRYNRIVLALLPLFWLPSYLLIKGIPPLFPAEANHWLWILLLASVVINFICSSRQALLVIFQAVLLVLILTAVVWPVMQYQFDILLLLELVVIIATAFVLYRQLSKKEATTPALSLAISSGGMGLVVALAGSLVIGQLAGAMASILGLFALTELIRRKQVTFGAANLIPFIQLYLVLLVIARVFAELQLVPAILLLAAPVMALVITKRTAPLFSLASIVAAISWLLLTTESTGYY